MDQQKDANSIFQIFLDLFRNVLNNLAPITIEEHMNSSNKKSRYLKKFDKKHQLSIICKEKVDYSTYRIIKNNTSRQLRKANNGYTKRMFENLADLKEQRTFINTRLKQNVKHNVSESWSDNIILKGKKQLARTLNNCFSRLGVQYGLKEKNRVSKLSV